MRAVLDSLLADIAERDGRRLTILAKVQASTQELDRARLCVERLRQEAAMATQQVDAAIAQDREHM